MGLRTPIRTRASSQARLIQLVDTDGDCIPDGVEDSNQNGERNDGELDPLGRDSDGDGISDGLEDTSCDGLVDEGEADPQHGLGSRWADG